MKIGDFLEPADKRLSPHDPNISNLKKIEKIRFSDGWIETGPYKATKTQQVLVKNGSFVFSGLNIEKGALALNQTGENLTVSANYSTMDLVPGKINSDYFKFLISSNYFKKILVENLKKDYSFTRPKHILDIELNVPDLEKQGVIADLLSSKETKINDLKDKLIKLKNNLLELRKSLLEETLKTAKSSYRLEELCDFEKGSSPIQKTPPGHYPMVVTGEMRKTSEEYQFDDIAVCIPLVSSTGHGSKTLNYVHYQEGKFALGTILVALLAKDKSKINMKFLHQFLLINKDTILIALMRGMANVTLPIGEIKKIKLALPEISVQNQFEKRMRELDKFELEIDKSILESNLIMRSLLAKYFAS